MATTGIEKQVDDGRVFEDPGELSDEYKELVTGLLQNIGNTESTGAFAEQHMIGVLPNCRLKIGFTAKIQDEMGHAIQEYRLAESLGVKDREQLLREVLYGDASWRSFLHYPIDRVEDLAGISWIVEPCVMHVLHDLQNASYGPLARTFRRISREEEFHLRWGELLAARLATGTRAQQEELQAALDRWWPRIMQFRRYMVPDEIDERLMALGIKQQTNEEILQGYMDKNVPKFRKYGLTIPDDSFEYDEEAEQWRYTIPDPEDNEHIVPEEDIENVRGPESRERIQGRVEAFETTQWVRDALRAGKDGAGNYPKNPNVAGD